MEITLRLYNYVDGINDTPFPNKDEQAMFPFTYDANRMGGSPTINATVKHRLCLDDLWTDNVYAEFRGEKYFVMNTPSSSKDNEDERYEHDVELLSEREVLNHIYFIDAVQGDSEVDVYKSNTTKVQFMGNIKEFVSRLNSCFSYHHLDYTAVIDDGITSEDKLVSFEDKYILEALQEIFNIYDIPYYFVGKVVHIGYTENVITLPLKYGFDGALLSISKENANYQVINKIKGTGSSDNIPYYYPNESDDREAIEASGKKWITPTTNLMPSIYRETEGAEMFYEANNNTYPDGEGGYYEFENEYTDRNQKQGTTTFEEIKPTIKEMTNASGQRIDMFTEFAYDLNDNDETDEDGNYLHLYFFAKLRKFDGENGFNLFDHAIESQPMQISFTSGVCGACTFEIGVGEETQKNIVQVDEFGNLKRDEEGNVLWQDQTPQDRQNDTSKYEVWIALKKEDSTYGIVFPNASQNLKPSTSDTFVILGINLPTAYITAAEKRLEQSLIKYMWMNNTEKFTFSIKFSRIFFTEHPEVLEQLNENARVLIEYNGQQHTLYVDSFTYKTDESSPLPEIEVNLVDTLTIGQNSLQDALDSVKQDILSSLGGGDFLKQGLKYFIRKDVADYAKGEKTFFGLIRNLAGAIFGNYIKGESGANIDKDGAAEFATLLLRGALTIGNYIEKKQGGKITEQGVADLMSAIVRDKVESADFLAGALGQGFTLKKKSDGKSYLEVDELFVRIKALFTELEIKKLSYAGGNFIFSPAGIVLSSVEETESGYKCYFTNDDGTAATENLFRVDDLCLCQTFNIKAGVHQNVSNKRYWRACTEVGENYFVLSKVDCESNSDIPEAGDSVVVLGNKTDTERQNAIIISVYGEGSPSITQHNGINTYSLVGTEKTRISPTLNNFTGEFHFSSGENVKDITTGLNQKVNDAVKTLTEQAEYITAIQDDLEAVKNQADGAIESWFYDPVPTLDNEPAVNWTDDATKKVHLGDLYYDGEGKSYRFQLVDGKYAWKVIEDSDIARALAAAQAAQDTADGKRRVFVVQPTSESVYDVGDLWVNATYSNTYSNDLLRCKTSKVKGTPFSIEHWEKATKYTDDTTANKAIADAANAQQAADNADQKAQEAANRLNNWAADGTISPTEKPALKDEIARIDSDKEQITAGYTKYGLGTPSAFTSAYSSYRAQLVALTASSPESITIPSDFRTKQTTYYTQRSAALNAIAAAAKDLADSINTDLQGYKTTVESKFSATNDKITAAVTETKTYTDGKVSEVVKVVDSKLEVAKGEITAEVTSTVDNKINAIQIGGRNLLTGTKDFNGWSLTNWGTNPVFDSSMPYLGFLPVKLTYPFTYARQSYTFEEGKTYTISAWVRTNIANKIDVGMYFITGTVYSNVIDKADTWIRYKKTFTISKKNATKKNVRIESSNASSTNPLWVCGIKLEEGNKATDWSPAPEDTEKSISDLSARITITEEGIKQTVTKTEFNQSKTEILNTAAQDALNKANTAKNEAISTASSDATNKANQAKNDAISTAATDAQAKADAAKNAAIADAAKKYATITTVTQMQTSIDSLGTEISLKASKSELTTVKNELTGNINSLTQRVSQAEINLKPDNIWIGISSKVDSVVNDIQVGGRNFIKSSDFIVQATSNEFAPQRTVSLVEGLNLNDVFLGKKVVFSYFVHCPGERTNNPGQSSLGNRFGIHGLVKWKNKSTGATILKYPFADCLEGSYVNQRVSMTYTFEPPSGYDTLSLIQFSFQPYARPSADNTEIWKIGQPKLEIGTKATDWTPAPEDYSTTEEIKTGITVSQNSINILGKSISLTGMVTFTSLASDAQGKINTAQSTANSANTAASNAQNTANSAKTTADSALSKANTAQSTAETARTEKIELARLGTTIIDGGHLKTSLIDADELFSQNITVSNNATITNLRAVNADVTGKLIANSGSQIGGMLVGSYSLTFEATNRIARFGKDVFPGSTAIESNMYLKNYNLDSFKRGIVIDYKNPTSSPSANIVDVRSLNYGIFASQGNLYFAPGSLIDTPGVIIAGRVGGNGSIQYSYGKKRLNLGKAAFTVDPPASSRWIQYNIIHNLGHQNYTVNVTPISKDSDFRKYHPHIIDVQNDNFIVCFIDSGTSNRTLRSDFYFSVIGENTAED